MRPNNLIFTPGRYVPISPFASLDGTSSFADIKVHPKLLAALTESEATIKAARYTNKKVDYLEVEHVDMNRGIVRIPSVTAGIYTIVTEKLHNDFPIVTNWNAALNGGRGGSQAGGTDGIGVLRLHEETGECKVELPLQDNDIASPYYYRTDAYALFAAEKDGEHQRTPAYERYIGETYSVVRVTDEAALKLSDEVMKLTGYPVIFRNPGTALDELEGVPAFQLVHGRIAGQGEHRSMVSYILPPEWSRTPEARYPALFSGFYDQNENVFANVGPALLNVLGQTLLDTGKGAVGIIWNGGGSFGTRTMHGSLYENLDDLFLTAIEQFAVDGNAIVTVGGSRGGITSLIAAGNPNSSVYSVRYAICYNVPLAFGEPFKEMLNPTCPVCWRAVCEDTGYKYAWQPGWQDGDGRRAVDLFFTTLLGTDNMELIASERSPASNQIIHALKSKGTKVWLTHGTHDAYTSSWLSFEWADRARRHGVDVRHEIGYRYGHNNCTDPFQSAKTCLTALLNQVDLPVEGTWHYRRASEVQEEWERSEQFEPTHQPVFVEAPKIAVVGLPILLIVYGEPGMEYELILHPSSEVERAKPVVLMAGTMSQLEGYRTTFSFEKTVQIVSEQIKPGLYDYRLLFRRNGSEKWENTAVYCPHPGFEGQATLTVTKDIPNFASNEWLEQTTKHAIGWGLSEA
ncbi:hypothetical protein BK120_16335 [Paenibacillus sp. FSL A5-0031]|uniref:hypothetical protein n=1 Tax=Paenibacillus sp. FSL A5-0031 TaxID=1920420 RepID=UPI00096DF430|nr:hypothetical protein [Paenibacillus sp. FSL A5-0031]OME82225.1 hypothetical protein BK120_16335 [Paenibacillus sp. FSL A5-0031]